MRTSTLFQLYLNILFLLVGISFYLLTSSYVLYSIMLIIITVIYGNIVGRIIFRKIPVAMIEWFTNSLIGDRYVNTSKMEKEFIKNFTKFNNKKGGG